MKDQMLDTVSGLIKLSARRNSFLRTGLFFVLLISEAAIFIFGAYYFDVFSTNKNLTYNLVLCAVFLTVALRFKSDKRLNKYWRIPFAFFIGATAFPVTDLLSDWIGTVLKLLTVTTETSQGLAIEKISEMLIKVIPILTLVKISGADFGSVFIKRGKLKLGMSIGWLVFFFLAPASFMFAAQRFTSLETLTNAVVWGLAFSFANAFMEELWLRGIFLKQFTLVLGEKGSVWLTSMIFAAMHSFAYYFMPEAIPFFALNTLALGLACGYLMIKSGSILGSVIIHAASDFFLFVAVLANV
jgi:membrane protease YdiL (CAAX protease family)